MVDSKVILKLWRFAAACYMLWPGAKKLEPKTSVVVVGEDCAGGLPLVHHRALPYVLADLAKDSTSARGRHCGGVAVGIPMAMCGTPADEWELTIIIVLAFSRLFEAIACSCHCGRQSWGDGL